MTDLEIQNKINEVRKNTFDELMYNLNTYGKCAFIRPTGYGKTTTMSMLCSKYNKVLYLYPSEVVKDTVILKVAGVDEEPTEEEKEEIEELLKCKDFKNITFMTYSKLIRLSEEDFNKMDYDLVCFDEMHRLGALATKKAIKSIMKSLEGKAHFIGATATPNRSDSFDVVANFFDGIRTFTFTLKDAFDIGLLKRPYYVYCVGETVKDKQEALKREFNKMILESSKTDINRTVIDKEIIEIARLYNTENIIKEVCHKLIKENYLKFIVFFGNIAHLKEKKDTVVQWFQNAYPEYSVSVLEVSSENTTTHDNQKKINGLIPKENHIDLICCVDMINMGFHINSLTGIVMYRQTTSNIIFTQQLGRALSSGTSKNGIVFDIVNNMGIASLYDSFIRKEEDKPTKREFFIRMSDYRFDAEKCMWFHKETNEPYPLKENQVISSDGYIYTKNSKEEDPNAVYQKDVILTGIEASERELMRKAVAEGMLMDAQKAFSYCMKVFCKSHNVPFPISQKKLEEVYGYTREDFNAYWKNECESGRVHFALGDARILLEGSKDIYEQVCRIFNMTLENVLSSLGY